MKVGGFCGHPGAVPGFSSAMWYLPERGATVIVNVNRNDEFNPPPSGPLVEAIARVVFQNHVD